MCTSAWMIQVSRQSCGDATPNLAVSARAVAFCLLQQRRKLAQALHCFHDAVRDVVHFFLAIKASKAKPDRAVREIFGDTERAQDVARLERRRSAGRAARHSYVADAHQQSIAFNTCKTEVQIIRQAMNHCAVYEAVI